MAQLQPLLQDLIKQGIADAVDFFFFPLMIQATAQSTYVPFLFFNKDYESESEVAQSCPTLCDPVDCRPPGSRLLCPWDFPGKNTGAGCHFLLQGIFPTQGSNLGLPLCGQTL